MFELLHQACNQAKKAGATYADARVVSLRHELIVARDKALENYQESSDRGFGVRVLYKGAWGFASSPILTPDEVDRVVKQALKVADASALSLRKGGVQWAEEPAWKDHFESPREVDPFSVSLEDKASFLIEANEIMLQQDKVMRAMGNFRLKQVQRFYVNTDGSELSSDVISSSGGITAIAVGNNDFQTRTWDAGTLTQGFEMFDKARFKTEAQRVAAQAEEKLFAPQPPAGELDLVLDSHHLALTIHESVGHATELDRVMGYEVSLAGYSFADIAKKDNFKYGSELVTLMADNTLESGMATQGFDDDGVPSQKWPIVENGILRSYSTGREFSHAINEERSRGCCRADHWSSIPIVRIPNLGLMPGKETCNVDDLIADVKSGLYFEGMGSFSIDQRRWNFQFGGDCVWEIKDGKKAGIVKAPIYQSITPEFWGSCDAICDESHWEKTGVMNCGKGDPMQINQMTHGASPARFRKITAGPGRVN